ncbi:restriction endonuclease subunit S [Acinetobacter qingfengensis]|uniref:Type I restriction endonuclease subunit S n=1 Tax=Acinetobacter qingfengensis TaxID=1262585 RepID=A0A1E7RDT7_9GAMM|nr:restriction endonuclease subunit S [Acinetobacter qingfengensis]KAA8734486.1 restriction endonuclease subunit S [Acinetobacter qingfengensis]OEY97524.1 type I restriction endonuclease subunit S [Acinetobacter qingfengensis]
MTDVKKLITEHLDIWLTAETEKKSGRGRGSGSNDTIYGIQKLRQLILDLAISGNLVKTHSITKFEQEPLNLSKSNSKKIDTNSIKEKLIDNIFEIPSAWAWETLGNLFYFENGDRGKNYPNKDCLVEIGVPFVNAGHLKNDGIDTHEMTFITQEKFDSLNSGKFTGGDFLYCLRGSLGKYVVVQKDLKGAIASSLVILRAYDPSFIDYISLYLQSNFAKKQIKIYDNGTAQPNLSSADLRKFLVPMPSKEERKLIVNKVDELMQLCDQLEQHQNLSSEAHDQLVDTLLNVLTNSSDVEEFQQNWRRISENFDLLFTTQYSVEQLKQTILQLAVMGKLVKQDPNDEPASELLEQIAEEKLKLVKEGKIKKSKPLPEITDEEKPYEVPHNWNWVYLNNIAYVGTGATPSRSNPEYWNPKDLNWLSSGETANDFVEKTNEMVSELALKETNLTIYPVGSLIVAMYGQGKTRGQVTELNIPAATNQACAGIIPVLEALENRRYIKLFFQKIYDEIREIAEGGAQPNLNLNKIQQTKIPLPPINEQKRIVSKVNQLFFIIEQFQVLQSKLRKTKLHLADSLVINALNDSKDNNESETEDNIIQFEKPIEAVKQSNQKVTEQIDLFTYDSVDDDLKLLSLAAEITFQLHTEPTFGHLKLQKLIYLCQQLKHMDLAADFKQHAAGPYDPVMARYLDKEFKDREWFSYDPKRDVKYKPLTKCNEHRSAFNKYFAKETSDIYALVGLFRTSKSDHIEIVATLFACWLRLLERKLFVTEEQLLKDFYAWSKEKKEFSQNEVLNGLKWMKQNAVVPL